MLLKARAMKSSRTNLGGGAIVVASAIVRNLQAEYLWDSCRGKRIPALKNDVFKDLAPKLICSRSLSMTRRSINLAVVIVQVIDKYV